MLRLCWAQFLISFIPFDRWRHSLGPLGDCAQNPAPELARRLAADVEWAAKRLPFPAKCLPRAMALTWMLRRRRIGHAVVIAVRPADRRDSIDALHAWVEVDRSKILGDLPGPWIETLRFEG